MYLLHFFELQKREKGGETSQRRPWGMVDVALTPWAYWHGSCQCCWVLMWLPSMRLSSMWLTSMQLTSTWLMWTWCHRHGSRLTWDMLIHWCSCWGSTWLLSSWPLLGIDSHPCPTSLSQGVYIQKVQDVHYPCRGGGCDSGPGQGHLHQDTIARLCYFDVWGNARSW